MTTLDAPRTLLNRYELLRKLDSGASGVIYEALDLRSGERLALKALNRVAPNSIANFKHEFRAVQGIHHPNLVRLEALFEDQGTWMIAMELVDGADLLTHLYRDRPDRCFDEKPLRDAFGQLVQALDALHSAGFVHRDLKPANVRVTRHGRVVLLDFGLTEAIGQDEQSIREGGFGTVTYMAPEQAMGAKPTPATDFYALGVCLYQAMTGILPVDADDPVALLRAKQVPVAITAGACAEGIPHDLDRLCSSLLDLSPAARPNAPQILRTLRGTQVDRSDSGSLPPDAANPDAPSFEGREQELERLEELFEHVDAGACEVVLIEGDSGIGKTALVKQFLRRHRDALVLRSRCYENELLAYKAFDGAMEELAHVLSKLSEAERDALLPPRAGLLGRLFPALAIIAGPMREEFAATDLSAQRREAFAMFGRLMSALGERSPVVLSIDDLQWADVESFRLLQSWLDSSPARCLIIATLRPRAEISENEVGPDIAALRRLDFVTEIGLTGLPPAAARRLTRTLAGDHIPNPDLDAILVESGGHPLFLTVMTRFAQSLYPGADRSLTLEVAIASRVSALRESARHLLALVATAGSPMSAPLCGRAAGLDDAELGRLVTELCQQKLLRRRQAGEISCFHDRIRRVVLERLPPEHGPRLHAALARALASAPYADPAQLARHYQAAGELSKAMQAYEGAAQRAIETLAFARAASLYALALEASSGLHLPKQQRTALRVAYANALARSGRSEEAASAYLEAARGAEGEENTRLRIWAAQHLLQSANVERGMGAARELLAELRVPLAASTAGVLVRMLWDRMQLQLGGIERRAQTTPISTAERMRLDALAGIALPMTWLDPLASAALTARHARLALAISEPAHQAQALAGEAYATSFGDPSNPLADRLLRRARSLAETSADPALEVGVAFREGCVANLRFDLLTACERLEHAQQVGSSHCPDQPWLLTNVRIGLSNVWVLMGQHGRLAAQCQPWLAEAHERNDRFALSLLEGFGGGYQRYLMRGDPDRARTALEAALAPWPVEPFSIARVGELLGVVMSELYRGGPGAHLWLEQEHRRLARAFLLKTPPGQAVWQLLRGCAALAAHHDERGPRAAQLLGAARTALQKLKRIDTQLGKMTAALLEAQLAALEGARERALQTARDGRYRCETCGFGWMGHTLEYIEGTLLGGDEGAALQRSALDFFADQGWRDPLAAVRIHFPAMEALQSKLVTRPV